jgi:hypothetical protein
MTNLRSVPLERKSSVLKFHGTNQVAVVPAQAGTHNHRGFGYPWPCHIALLRRMGPRLSGDDKGESLLHPFPQLIAPSCSSASMRSAG